MIICKSNSDVYLASENCQDKFDYMCQKSVGCFANSANKTIYKENGEKINAIIFNVPFASFLLLHLPRDHPHSKRLLLLNSFGCDVARFRFSNLHVYEPASPKMQRVLLKVNTCIRLTMELLRSVNLEHEILNRLKNGEKTSLPNFSNLSCDNFELLLYIKVEYFERIFAAGIVNDVIDLLKNDHTYSLLSDLRDKSYLNSGDGLNIVGNTESLGHGGEMCVMPCIETEATVDEYLDLSLNGSERLDGQKCSTKGKKPKRSPTSMRCKKIAVTTPLVNEEEQKGATLSCQGSNHDIDNEMQENLPGMVGESQSTEQLPDFEMIGEERAGEVDETKSASNGLASFQLPQSDSERLMRGVSIQSGHSDSVEDQCRIRAAKKVTREDKKLKTMLEEITRCEVADQLPHSLIFDTILLLRSQGIPTTSIRDMLNSTVFFRSERMTLDSLLRSIHSGNVQGYDFGSMDEKLGDELLTVLSYLLKENFTPTGSLKQIIQLALEKLPLNPGHRLTKMLLMPVSPDIANSVRIGEYICTHMDEDDANKLKSHLADKGPP